MKRANPAWYVVAAVAILGPVGLRMYCWPKHEPQQIDPAMAQTGKMLFTHDWKMNDPLSPNGDGLGPVFNATSCVACHKQGGIGGAGGLEHNVTTFVVQPQHRGGKVREGVVHAFATRPEFQETLFDVHTQLPAKSQVSLDSIVPGSTW